jgi:hypothetical protein
VRSQCRRSCVANRITLHDDASKRWRGLWELPVVVYVVDPSFFPVLILESGVFLSLRLSNSPGGRKHQNINQADATNHYCRGLSVRIMSISQRTDKL